MQSMRPRSRVLISPHGIGGAALLVVWLLLVVVRLLLENIFLVLQRLVHGEVMLMRSLLERGIIMSHRLLTCKVLMPQMRLVSHLGTLQRQLRRDLLLLQKHALYGRLIREVWNLLVRLGWMMKPKLMMLPGRLECNLLMRKEH